MKNLPLIHELIKCKSLSSFIRSMYFKNNFRSVSRVLVKLDAIRLRHDFPFWICKTYDPDFSFNGFQTLVMKLQKLRSSTAFLLNPFPGFSCLLIHLAVFGTRCEKFFFKPAKITEVSLSLIVILHHCLEPEWPGAGIESGLGWNLPLMGD